MIKYRLKQGSNVTTAFLLETVAPGIAAFYPEQHNKVAEVLALPLLWAAFEPSCEHRMAPEVRNRIRNAYDSIRGDNPLDYNPVEKVLLHIYRIENSVLIDEVIPLNPENVDVAGGNQQNLTQAQSVQQHCEQLQSIMIQIHQLNLKQAEFSQQIEAQFGSLRLHLQRQLDILNRNMRRLQVQPAIVVRDALRPRQPVVGAAPTNNDNNTNNARNQRANPVFEAEERAELSPRPKSLMELWTEFMFGIGGRKPAKDFTPSERGKCRHKYCRRKLVWDCIKRHVNCGYTPNAACERIHQCYGYNLSVTMIINAFKRDKQRGGHPNLRLVLPPAEGGRAPPRQRRGDRPPPVVQRMAEV